jgi:transcriptional regulator with XRE-family HTH domain
MAFIPIRRTTMFANYDQALPFVLYWVRIRQGLSQTDVARRMHVHRLWISNVECGDKCPAIGGLERLADALEIKVSQLLRMCEVLQGK